MERKFIARMYKNVRNQNLGLEASSHVLKNLMACVKGAQTSLIHVDTQERIDLGENSYMNPPLISQNHIFFGAWGQETTISSRRKKQVGIQMSEVNF